MLDPVVRSYNTTMKKTEWVKVFIPRTAKKDGTEDLPPRVYTPIPLIIKDNILLHKLLK